MNALGQEQAWVDHSGLAGQAFGHLAVARHLATDGQGHEHLVYYDRAWLTPALEPKESPKWNI